MEKPIESGCRAVIVGSKAGNDGIIVTVGRYIGYVEGFQVGNKSWEIDKTLTTVKGARVNFVNECLLRRIDDNEEKLSTWEEVAKECFFIPNRETVENE